MPYSQIVSHESTAELESSTFFLAVVLLFVCVNLDVLDVILLCCLHRFIAAQRRARFDQYGMDGLKQGRTGGEGKGASGGGGGWIFQSNPREMFAQFFGHSSPFAEYSNGESMFMESRDLTPKKMPTIEANLYVSLEELNAGAIKKQKVTRQALSEDMKSTRAEDKILTIDVQPGWKEGTRLTFPDAGDEGVGMAAGDIVLTLKEKPHPRFTRRKNDLVFNAKISLLQALCGCTVDVEMLDGRTLPIAIDQIVNPGYVKIVPGEGLPLSKNPKVKGNLLIEFAVTYPSQLSIKAKEQLSLLLPP